mgnify:CR=1 FL=1
MLSLIARTIPAFSTRAESLTNHRLGYDVIGMTNLGEAKCAREAEIAYATLAMVTDYDAWKAEAQRTVDDAHMRYFIAHIHRLRDEELSAGPTEELGS